MSEFDRFSGNYEAVLNESTAIFGEGSEYFAENKARFLSTYLPQGFCGKILDFGCGVGLISKAIAKYLPDAELHGYDISSASIDAMSSDIRAAGFFTSNLSELASDYDVIVISNVMHHIPPNERPRNIAALAARLAVGGRMAIFEHNPLNPLTRWVVAHCAFDDDAILLPRRETRSLTRNAGLKGEGESYLLFFPHFLRWIRRVEDTLGWCPLGAQYVHIAVK